VCFLSTYAYGLFVPGKTDAVGGAEVQFRYLSTALAADPDFTASVITGDFGQEAVEEHDGVTLYRGPTPRPEDGILRKLGQARRYYRLLRQIDADIYVTTATTTNILLVSRFCRRHGRKHIHRTAHEREIGELHRKRGLMPALYRAGFRTCDLIVTQHEAHRDALKRNTGVEARILRNAFPVENRGLPDDTREHVLWVGRCLPWKRPEALLRLAEKLPEAQFVMVAPGVDGAGALPRSVAEQASRARNVELRDHVPFAEVQDLFDRAKVFVNTSEQEGFPNTFIQAGLGAAPIVSLNVDPGGMISRTECGYVCGDSEQELARAVGGLLQDEAERRRRGNAAFAYVREHHDLAKVVEEFKGMLRELAPLNGATLPPARQPPAC